MAIIYFRYNYYTIRSSYARLRYNIIDLVKIKNARYVMNRQFI